ncbi:putative F0F1-ATPase subunit (Ca2+/Mg2+ transporter) [Melghirimyces profundicolus]|uniref:Putative F0F1-ATPase subunit (Ca2+/Mg2+ transporter) n=1 Tax=Melghirimyces profundicolus TaxID=1242148 RepID=A0A2T6C2G7_9BACL|nr:AtpZ/AtpI family protein [Melghirimyces profundicolus]PTX62509.1 putative F0F1-ATPase subunit (Ca2+/Mg2+ transporter) [Melghirimyces profundicolus]
MKKNSGNPLRTMGLVGTLGLEVVVFTLIGVWVGRKLDAVWGTQPVMMAVCVLTGLVLGFVSAALTLRSFMD